MLPHISACPPPLTVLNLDKLISHTFLLSMQNTMQQQQQQQQQLLQAFNMHKQNQSSTRGSQIDRGGAGGVVRKGGTASL